MFKKVQVSHITSKYSKPRDNYSKKILFRNNKMKKISRIGWQIYQLWGKIISAFDFWTRNGGFSVVG